MAADFVFVQSTGYDFESGPCGTGDGGREDIWGTDILYVGYMVYFSYEAA